jgi:hypothetical protein
MDPRPLTTTLEHCRSSSNFLANSHGLAGDSLALGIPVQPPSAHIRLRGHDTDNRMGETVIDRSFSKPSATGRSAGGHTMFIRQAFAQLETGWRGRCDDERVGLGQAA